MNIVKTVIKYLIDPSAKHYICYITVRLGYKGHTHHIDALYIWREDQSNNVWILLKTVIKYLNGQSAKQYRCYITTG